jgi:hypothetical protein
LKAHEAGPVKLVFNSTAGLSLWVDGVPHDLQPETTVDLAAGVRTLILAVRPSERSAALRVELGDVPGSQASVQIVGGK